MDDPREHVEGDKLGPMDEIELMDFQVQKAAKDEEKTMFDDETHPKGFGGLEDPTEPIADDGGEKKDLMADTDEIEMEIGEGDESVVDGLPEEF